MSRRRTWNNQIFFTNIVDKVGLCGEYSTRREGMRQEVEEDGRVLGMGAAMTPRLSYLICATPRSGSTLLCHALDATGISGHPDEHFEVLLETGRPRQPRDYFQRSNDPEVWVLLDDPEFQDVLGEYGGRYAEHPARRDPSWRPPTSRGYWRRRSGRALPRTVYSGPRSCGPTSATSSAWRAGRRG
jgi:hypothetical protein